MLTAIINLNNSAFYQSYYKKNNTINNNNIINLPILVRVIIVKQNHKKMQLGKLNIILKKNFFLIDFVLTFLIFV